MDSVARRPWIALWTALWIGLCLLPGAAPAQSPATAVGQALDEVLGETAPDGGLPAGPIGGPSAGSGPMTWGGVLSRSLLHQAPGSGVAAAELVDGRGASPDTPEDGAILPQSPVVELFTSQGCAACPPADAFFAEIAERGDVIALALHVDYWDYIGWADAFARGDHTKRQKAYAKASGSKVIYTPQVVVDGQRPMPGNDAARVAALVEDEAAAPPVLSLRLRAGDGTAGGGRPVLTAHSLQGAGEMIVQLVRYQPEKTVTIERGENAGRTITYRNIVTGWEVLGRWDGRQALRLDLPPKGAAAEAAVVLFQQAGHGPIVAAARLP